MIGAIERINASAAKAEKIDDISSCTVHNTINYEEI